MKLVGSISRYLLGFVFLVYGINGFLSFIPPRPIPALAVQFVGSPFVSHYSVVVFGAQVVIGVLLLADLFVPLALVILAPIIVNIIAYYAFREPSALPLAILVLALWLLVSIERRSAFDALLQPRTNLPVS
jgi:putative oxidoreductase